MSEETRSGWVWRAAKSLLLLLVPAAPAGGGGPAPWGGPGIVMPPGAVLWRWRSQGREGLAGRCVVRIKRSGHRRAVGVEGLAGRSFIARHNHDARIALLLADEPGLLARASRVGLAAALREEPQ